MSVLGEEHRSVRDDTSAPANVARGPRSDIQGLRALAVAVVVAYHLAPDALTGGYVGVDVFFVLSGFLITTHLLAHPPRRAADLVAFWGRRLRRLLPASMVVLGATLVGTRLIAPETLWGDTARQARAAGLYAVNWLLAGDATDYLAAADAPTPVQHYWSLSVEEQFYLFWPLLIAVLTWLAARTRLRRETVWACGLGAVALASLVWSVRLTESDPGRAYFVTPTRVWELAVGGLVALALLTRPVREGRTRSGTAWIVLAWAGLAAVAWAVLTFDADTAFPGWRAALPVLGTAAVLLACVDTSRRSPGRLLAWRPAQWLGDVSYAVYLWHWPILVLVAAAVADDPEHLGWLPAVGVVVATLVLAQLTTRYVEAPFRTASWNRRTAATWTAALVAMAVVVTAATVQLSEVERRAAEAADRVAAALASDDPCLGAGSLDPALQCPDLSDSDQPVVPTPAAAAEDWPQAFPEAEGGQECRSVRPRFPQVTCVFGDPDGRIDVALVGNSHAAHWLPALQGIAELRGWRITTHIASRCAFSAVEQDIEGTGAPQNCRRWAERTAQTLVEDDPDLVVVSDRILEAVPGKALADSTDDYVAGFVDVLGTLTKAHLRTAVIRNIPTPDAGGVGSVPECLSAHGEHSDACDGPLEEWLFPKVDPAATALAEVTRTHRRARTGVIDLNDRICDGDTCRAVVGGVVGWADGSHLTATFDRTLASALDEALREAGLMPR
ncbi:acyltransferase family protein [Nocardioides yefusunii]|uniref:Acyltransferase family protein n=1 Tax=Nocardioides yefusunii TaxID=2500546 RepID=A0ABW1QWZ9_9ACTN|nr:acyltransferase family protein [Nocardioides yefusunii]